MSTEELKPTRRRKASFEDTVTEEDFTPSPVQKKIVTIEPYFDPEIKNMGYERYGFSGFPGGSETHDLGYIEVSSVTKRYLTGLDPFAKAVVTMTNEDEKEAIIDQIEIALDWLEKRGYSREMLNPTNEHFWKSKNLILLNNSRKDLDMSDAEDFLVFWNIRGGGYDFVAQSLEDATKSNRTYKWYLSELEVTAGTKTEGKKLKNDAKEELNKAFREKPRKLFYVAKDVLSSDNYFKNSTPSNLLYEKLDDFIEGIHLKSNKGKAPKAFLDSINKSEAALKLNALVKDAIFFRFLVKRGDGLFYNSETGTSLGKNESEVTAYFTNPQFQSELDDIEDKVTKKWQA